MFSSGRSAWIAGLGRFGHHQFPAITRCFGDTDRWAHRSFDRSHHLGRWRSITWSDTRRAWALVVAGGMFYIMQGMGLHLYPTEGTSESVAVFFPTEWLQALQFGWCRG